MTATAAADPQAKVTVYRLPERALPERAGTAFGPRTCNATGAVLASTGTNTIDANFKRGEPPNTWYHGALADSIAKTVPRRRRQPH